MHCLPEGEIPEQELLPLINHSTRRLVSKQENGFVNILGSEARILMSDALKLNEPAEWNWVRHS